MDNPTDLEKSGNLGRFFDQAPVSTNPFGDNRSAERAYLRAERITAALYLLTNHIASDEPLRQSVRENSLFLIGHLLTIRDEMRSPESAKLSSLRSSIRHIISLVRMLTVSGFVSLQNADIVIEALDELGNLLNTSQRSALSESVSISREDLSSSPIGPVRSVKPTLKVKDKSGMSVTSPFKMNVRKENIVQILKSRGELGIRDIAANMPEYSEKTVQRELAELVALGRVTKTGQKRWSRYSLAPLGD